MNLPASIEGASERETLPNSVKEQLRIVRNEGIFVLLCVAQS